MGVKLMDLRGAEKLQAIAPVVSQADEETPETDDAAVAEEKERSLFPVRRKAKKK